MVNTEDGRPVTHYFLKENQFCTILNSFNKQEPAEEIIQAACDAEILVATRNRLLKLYEQVPYLKELMDQIIQQALLDKIRIRNTYLGHDATTQYKLFLIQQPDIAARVSLNDIASYLSITPQSLSRIRKNIR
jgi:CRP-like cAMP-binding protein